MKSKSLSLRLKADLANHIASRALLPRVQALAKLENSLARQLYDRVVPEKLQQHLAEIPPDFLNQNPAITASFAGCIRSFFFGCQLPLNVTGYWNVSILIEKDDDLSSAWKHYADTDQQISADRGVLRSKSLALILPAKTNKQLFKLWPGIVEHISSEWKDDLFADTPPTDNLPAICYEVVDELIKALKGEKS